ncbi:MAG: FAD-dependent oxidoreductase [Alphaproteobacteria bacterium]|nr:FAD-dependent oxidoreductase [Alphaproteobacteria bacterium]
MDRRTFVKWLTAGAAGSIAWGATGALAAASFRAVIVGGGMAGATAAKFLRMWGGTGVSVTLIDANAAYKSCIMSNKVLTGERSLASLSYNYAVLRRRYGVQFVNAAVTGIDPDARQVILADQTTVPYDRLILAPGIEFDYSEIAGMDAIAQGRITHAWKAGSQTTKLRNQLVQMVNGSTFVLTVPRSPYRCPPGPYERACVVADWLRVNKPNSKLIVLDCNTPSDPGNPLSAIQAEPVSFANAFTNIHHNIEYHSGVTINSVNSTGRRIETSIGSTRYGVLNLIPPQKAGRLITDTGLGLNNVGARWAGVNVLSYESTAVPRVHVIGDSMGSSQPKAGHIGNQEAKVCADAIIRLENGLAPYGRPVTNSACYTPITATTATWLTAVFAYDPATASMKVVGGKPSEPVEGPTSTSHRQMNRWFDSLMADTFA